jgi:F0F1-type ATP synthase membrane subunit b/b'
MASYKSCIEGLLQAEARAELIIKEAQGKADLILDSVQDKAKAEIELVRAELEKDFVSKRVDTTSEDRNSEERVAGLVRENEEIFKNNKGKIVDMLIDRIMTVSYELPRNVKADFDSLKAPAQL